MNSNAHINNIKFDKLQLQYLSNKQREGYFLYNLDNYYTVMNFL